MVAQLTPRQAANWIKDGNAVMFGGFIGAVVPEAIERAIAERFISAGHPRDLTLVFAAGQGDGKERALNHLAQQGLVARVIGGHWGLVPKLAQLAVDELIEGYNLPQGIISHLLRDTAAGKPGTLSKVGLNTFVDPRLEGAKINRRTVRDWVSVQMLEGEEFLFYRRLPVDVAVIRGTTADTRGNITMEDECLIVENLVAAQAAKNQGGKVIVQVKQVVEAGTLDPHSVKIPGILVDAVVVAEDQKEHMQTFATAMNPAFVSRGPRQQPSDAATSHAHSQALDAKTIIARRAAMELQAGAILNLGIGTPEYVAEVANECGVIDQLNLTVEPGAIGGSPAKGLDFGASVFPEAIISQDQMFDFYDGGGIDQAFLGLAQCSFKGDINVSRFGSKIAGCGGFINISQNAKQLYFCGSFTAKGLRVAAEQGQLQILQEGKQLKFISQVEQVTFSGERAAREEQPVLYITERAVFRLDQRGLVLEEIAPGVDLERDILAHMAFRPIISEQLQLMDAHIFSPNFTLTLAKNGHQL
ncbi:acyl CoA:acetate/3-ketoacid CoA transferase [Aliagarivorans marinus]|uniref:acyl CoA:acetate/3-ketoacid CoA transferase n=1 Tax=Aliagarivorans marinus TaxID=561965 RepID=UPI0004016E0C|nr:CoA-transferase [Aliagarivorans marinus]